MYTPPARPRALTPAVLIGACDLYRRCSLTRARERVGGHVHWLSLGLRHHSGVYTRPAEIGIGVLRGVIRHRLCPRLGEDGIQKGGGAAMLPRRRPLNDAGPLLAAWRTRSQRSLPFVPATCGDNGRCRLYGGPWVIMCRSEAEGARRALTAIVGDAFAYTGFRMRRGCASGGGTVLMNGEDRRVVTMDAFASLCWRIE